MRAYAECRNKAKENKKNTTGAAIEADVKAQLEREGIKTSVAGTTSPTGEVKIEKQKGPCANVKEADIQEHEDVHKKTQQELEKKYGKGTKDFDKAWNDGTNWANDEINAYGAGKATMDAFLAECKKKFGITPPAPKKK